MATKRISIREVHIGGDLPLAVNALIAASAVAVDRHDLDAAEGLLDEALALQPSSSRPEMTAEEPR